MVLSTEAERDKIDQRRGRNHGETTARPRRAKPVVARDCSKHARNGNI
jgi:hypothetical protein